MGKKKNQINYWKTLFHLHIFHKDFKSSVFFNDGSNSEIKMIGKLSQLAFTCSKLTIQTLEQGVKYVQN